MFIPLALIGAGILEGYPLLPNILRCRKGFNFKGLIWLNNFKCQQHSLCTHITGTTIERSKRNIHFICKNKLLKTYHIIFFKNHVILSSHNFYLYTIIFLFYFRAYNCNVTDEMNVRYTFFNEMIFTSGSARAPCLPSSSHLAL